MRSDHIKVKNNKHLKTASKDFLNPEGTQGWDLSPEKEIKWKMKFIMLEILDN